MKDATSVPKNNSSAVGNTNQVETAPQFALSRRKLLCSVSTLGFANALAPSFITTFNSNSSERTISEQVDTYIQNWMKLRNVSGASVGVLQAGEVAHLRGYGKGDRGQAIPVSVNTCFEIASLTKQMTAFAILLLVRDGKLKLTDPISKHLETPNNLDSVTIRHLLTHTSGLKDYTSLPEFSELMTREPDKSEVTSLILDSERNFRPGDRWQYSNSGYYLAGLIIEKCSGKEFEQFLKERIFDPIGMQHTARPRLRSAKYLAEGLEWKSGAFEPCPLLSWSLLYSAAGIVSTAEDLLKWQKALDTDILLPEKLRTELWQGVKLSSGRSPDNVALFNSSDNLTYGLGWFVRPNHTSAANSASIMLHYGSSWGYSSYIVKVPRIDLTVVVLTNRESIADARPFFTPYMLAEGIARILAPNAIRNNHPTVLKRVSRVESLNALKACIAGLRSAKPLDKLMDTSFLEGFSSQVQDYHHFLVAIGQAKDISLVSEKSDGTISESVYKVSFKSTSWLFELTLAAGKVFHFAAVEEVS